jgi:hypothetical protein
VVHSEDTTSFIRVVLQRLTKRTLFASPWDTTDFSRVEIQFQPLLSAERQVEIEEPRD